MFLSALFLTLPPLALPFASSNPTCPYLPSCSSHHLTFPPFALHLSFPSTHIPSTCPSLPLPISIVLSFLLPLPSSFILPLFLPLALSLPLLLPFHFLSPLRDVGEAISKVTSAAKFSIVTTYCGHGKPLLDKQCQNTDTVHLTTRIRLNLQKYSTLLFSRFFEFFFIDDFSYSILCISLLFLPSPFLYFYSITIHISLLLLLSGIGQLFHTSPTVPHYPGNKSKGRMEVGHVFTIEPMINIGRAKDGLWPDGKRAMLW